MIQYRVPAAAPADWPPQFREQWAWAVAKVGAPVPPPPNPAQHNPDPAYVRELVARCDLSMRACAPLIGISYRTLREYCRPRPDPFDTTRACPYPVQYALECLAAWRRPAVHPPPCTGP